MRTLCGRLAAVLFAWALGTWDERATINCRDRAGLRVVDGGGDFLDVRPDHGPVDRGHNQHGKRPALRPLLCVHVLVAGYENVKPLLLDQGK